MTPQTEAGKRLLDQMPYWQNSAHHISEEVIEHIAAIEAEVRASLTPEPTEVAPSIDVTEPVLDVRRVAKSVENVARRHHIAKDPEVLLVVMRVFGYSAATPEMDDEIAAEYARLAVKGGSDGVA